MEINQMQYFEYLITIKTLNWCCKDFGPCRAFARIQPLRTSLISLFPYEIWFVYQRKILPKPLQSCILAIHLTRNFSTLRDAEENFICIYTQITAFFHLGNYTRP